MKLPIKEFCDYMERAFRHYEKSAPPVSDYLNDLYIRIGESPETVTLVELTAVSALVGDDGLWEHPNYAANRFYKLAAATGKDTTGLAGF